MKGGELRGSEHLIEGKGEARQVASRVDLVSEEFLKLAVRGRCLHDVGHFVSEQLELEVGGVKRVLLKEYLEDGVRAARVLRRNCAEMNFGLGVVPSSLNQRVYRMFEAVAVEVTVGLHPKSFRSIIGGNVRRRKVFLYAVAVAVASGEVERRGREGPYCHEHQEGREWVRA